MRDLPPVAAKRHIFFSMRPMMGIGYAEFDAPAQPVVRFGSSMTLRKASCCSGVTSFWYLRFHSS